MRIESSSPRPPFLANALRRIVLPRGILRERNRDRSIAAGWQPRHSDRIGLHWSALLPATMPDKGFFTRHGVDDVRLIAPETGLPSVPPMCRSQRSRFGSRRSGVQIQRPDLKVLPDQTPNPDSPHEGETDITQQSVFRTKAQRDEVVELYDALEGARQHLERLGAYVAELTGNLTTKGGAS